MLSKNPGLVYYHPELKQVLTNSIKEKYHFIGKLNHYNPTLSLYNTNRLYEKKLNHQYTALEIGEKISQINESTRKVKLLVCLDNKPAKSQWRKAIIKELPLLPLKHTGLLKRASQEPTRNKISNFLIFSNLYSINNSAYIEILVNYLCSNLVENKITTHFPLFYGNMGGILKTFTYSESQSSSVSQQEYMLPKNHVITNRGKKTYIKIPKLPTHLVFQEDVGLCLGDLLDANGYHKEEWMSYVFQVIAALSIVQSRYKLIHNDLHLGNVMCKKTDRKFLYYQLSENKYFKIPTYGRIIKLIDWGRAVLELPSQKIWNNCFNLDFEVFGQYYPPNEYTSQKTTVLPNSSFDMTIFTHSLLDPDYNLPNDNFIKFLHRICHLKNGVNIYQKYENLNFGLYCEIAKYADQGDPIKLVQDPIFNEFLVDKPNIRKGDTIYPLT